MFSILAYKVCFDSFSNSLFFISLRTNSLIHDKNREFFHRVKNFKNIEHFKANGKSYVFSKLIFSC
jgi:hypothetical protein